MTSPHTLTRDPDTGQPTVHCTTCHTSSPSPTASPPSSPPGSTDPNRARQRPTPHIPDPTNPLCYRCTRRRTAYPKPEPPQAANAPGRFATSGR